MGHFTMDHGAESKSSGSTCPKEKNYKKDPPQSGYRHDTNLHLPAASPAAHQIDASRPKTVLVINNNPNEEAGLYTQLVLEHLTNSGIIWHEVRSVEQVDAFADSVDDDNDVGLILTCGSRIVLTEPVDVGLHITKTTAAMLHFPNAPIVGICFGMQLVAQLYGGVLKEYRESRYTGTWEPIKRTVHEGCLTHSQLFEGLGDSFLQWATNFIFVERIPPHFVATAVDDRGRVMAMEHKTEHVYGVQFHPEVVHEVVGKTLMKKIIGLLGQNRRPLQDGSGCKQWNCSKQCQLRRAIKDATHGSCEDGILQHDRSASQGQRIANARREALRALQRDHCNNGGITVSALEDAVVALTNLASNGECGAGAATAIMERVSDTNKTPAQDSSIREEAPQICSPHDADLRLRTAIHEALRKSKTFGEPESAKELVAESPVQKSQLSAVPCSAGDEASSLCTTHVSASDPQQSSVAKDDVSSNEKEWYPIHEADLQLRQAAKEIISSGKATGHLGKSLSAAKRDMLAELKRNCNSDGYVSIHLVEDCKAKLWELLATKT